MAAGAGASLGIGAELKAGKANAAEFFEKLGNATTVASMLLTTEAAVVDIQEKTKPAMPDMSGMGGMGGMM